MTGKRKSYRRVANELFKLGFETANGTSFKREFVCKLICWLSRGFLQGSIEAFEASAQIELDKNSENT